MSRNQTFSVSLNLLTKNFQKGVKTIQASLNNLKMQFRNFAAAMGAGLGISEIARSMVDSARKLDKAQTVLRNVSNGIENYADNQEFVMGLSRKYNQELTTLMGNYAKFYSAASYAGMALEEQKYIYESLTRAAAYYNLTAEETNGVMLAVNQMISKGKVSSEELRRQLGERLPGAMNLAAKAMNGITVGQLEEMIRKGDLLATELLPKLASELNKITKNVNVDNIEGATNKLKNAFTNLTTKLNVGGIYKKIINGVGDGLQYVADNLNKVGQSIAIVFGTLAGKPMIQKIHNSWSGVFDGIRAEIDQLEKKMLRLRERAHMTANSHNIKIDPGTLQPMGRIPIDPKAHKAFQQLKQTADEFSETQKLLITQQDALNNKLSTMGKKIGAQLKSVLKFVGIQAAYMAIAAAISTIITKLVSWYKEQQRIKNIVNDTHKEFKEMSDSLGGEEIELRELQKALKINTEKERAIRKINDLLGLQDKAMFTLASDENEINKKIQDRIELLKEERQYQSAKQIVANATNRKQELEDRNTSIAALQGIDVGKIMGKVGGQGSIVLPKLLEMFTDTQLKREYEKNAKEVDQLNKVIEHYTEIVHDLSLSAPDRDAVLNPVPDPGNGGGGGDNTLMEEYQEIQDEYNKDLRTLNEMKKNQLLTEEEYNKELEELTLKTAESILALNDIDENTDAFAKSILDAAKAYIANVEKEDKVKDALDEYEKNVKELQNQYNAGVITEKELNDGLFDLLQEVVKTISAMGELSGSAKALADKFIEQKNQKINDEAAKIETPELEDRDTTYDYKKTGADIAGENAEIWEEYVEKLESAIEGLKDLESTAEIEDRLKILGEELESATKKAESFKAAMNLATVKQDVDDLRKELGQGIFDNVSNIATAADRLTSSIKNVKDTLNDVEASEWDKILSVFNAIVQTVDTLMSTIQLVEGLISTMDKLKSAEQTYQTLQDMNTQKDLLNAGKSVIASQAEATGKGTAEAAKMPFPYNLIAIATVVGAIAAVFASLPKFAGGGIVKGGSSVGDKNLIRVNSGEMILNKGQQSTLFNLLDGKGSAGSGGNVIFELRGDKLIGVIENTKKKRSK